MLVAGRFAPAKINLALRVLGRRADGYHEIDSVLVPLDLSDEVRVTLEPDRPTEVVCRCAGRPELDGPDNLASQAARRYLEQSGRSARVEIAIVKRIWVAAGLGGGSSDAAAVLRLLDDLMHDLPRSRLVELAARLGSDVPFFLEDGPARVRGRGELIDPLPALPSLPIVLLNPGPLATAAVYAGLGLEPDQSTSAPPLDLRGLARLPAEASSLIVNDLEPVAVRLCPAIKDLRNRLLEAGAVAAAMTGSGATVFGLFDKPGQARAAAEDLGMSGFSVELTSTASA